MAGCAPRPSGAAVWPRRRCRDWPSEWLLSIRSSNCQDLWMEIVSGPSYLRWVVLCTCPAPVHLGGRLWTMPMSVLWSSTDAAD
jgi:hypothetical protein